MTRILATAAIATVLWTAAPHTQSINPDLLERTWPARWTTAPGAQPFAYGVYHSAVNQVGEGDRYLDLLGEWDAMLARGLTTWAEKPEPTRSTRR